MIDLPDTRELSSLDLGIEGPLHERLEASRRNEVLPKLEADRIRALLDEAHCLTAQDVIDLGCTGFFASGLKPDEIKLLRQGLTGVGLPCYVPLDRYCLIHETIGGLQKGQRAMWQAHVDAISRELQPTERGHIAVVEAVSQIDGEDRAKKARDVLSGRKSAIAKLGEYSGDDIVLDEGSDTSFSVPPPVVQAQPAAEVCPVPADWKCPEHAEVIWACRYCVAQEIVKGAFLPDFVVVGDDGEFEQIKDGNVEEQLAKFDAVGAAKVAVFVRAATFSRKLSR